MPDQTELRSDGNEDFSLSVGGPVYQLLRKAGLISPPLDRVGLRILVIASITWVPLLVMTIVNGRFLGGVNVPFLLDYEVHARLLVALPLLIMAERAIHHRVKRIVSQFQERQVVTDEILPRFEAIKESAVRLRNSVVIESGIAIFIVLAGVLSWRLTPGLQSETWLTTGSGGTAGNTPAGFWYKFVSLPIVQFLAFRWYFRLLVWGRLLWQTSRLDLNLVATHPDKSCGLGFLDGMAVAMAPLLLAHSTLLAGNLANRILHEGSKLPSHYVEIAIMAGFLLLLALGPLCVFAPNLMQAKRLGLEKYGRLASDFVVSFDRKWTSGQKPANEPILGNADFQSLADLANSYNLVRSVAPFPFGRYSLAAVAVIIALPLLPLSLTMFSLQEIAVRLVKILL